MKNCLKCGLPMPGAHGGRKRHKECANEYRVEQAFERWKRIQAAAGGPKNPTHNNAPCRDCGGTIPPDMGKYTVLCQECLDKRYMDLYIDESTKPLNHRTEKYWGRIKEEDRRVHLPESKRPWVDLDGGPRTFRPFICPDYLKP